MLPQSLVEQKVSIMFFSNSILSTSSRPLLASFTACLAFAVAPGCSTEARSSEAAGQGPAAGQRLTTLVVAREEGANSLDIQGVGTNRPAYGTSWNVYDRLITHGKKTLRDGQLSYDFTSIQPELAERWELDGDRSITFYLRKDATFHDGTPVTAADVKWSFDRAVSIGGFPTFQMKAGSLEKPEQFEVVDAHTFRVKLLRKDKLTLPDLAVPVAAIYNSKLAKRHATPDDPWAQQWLKNNAAGGGAYRVSKFEPGVQEVFTRFEAWKSGPRVGVDRVVVRVIPSASTRRAMLERGDVDISFDLPPRDAAELSQHDKLEIQGLPVENFMWFVDMNVTKPPFDDLNVRRAIAAAVPYDKIIESSCFGRCRALFGAPEGPPKTADWPQPFPYRTDLAKAKQLLAASRYPKGFESRLFLNLGLASISEPIAILLQQNLKQIGIDVSLEKVPAANWRGEMGKKSMPFLINDMGGWLNYADYFFFWNYHGQNAVFNTMSYQNSDMDRFIDSARFTEDEAAYERDVKGFIAKAFDDVPRIPLFQSNLDVAMKPAISGYQYWFHRQLDFRQLTVKGAPAAAK